MEIFKSAPKEGLKWRCKEHPNISCDFICLDGDAKDRVICFNCVQRQQIPFTNVISINCVLGSSEKDILDVYPPLKDQKLSDKIRNVNLQKSVEEMDLYFKNLREEFEKEMQLALMKAKQHQMMLEKTSQPLLKEYFRIAEIEKLKQLIKSDKQEAAKDLDNFIKDKWKKADENKNNLLKLLEQYEIEQQSYSLDQSYSIPLKMIENLQNINCKQKSNLPQFTLIKSTINTSQQMEIIKFDNSIYQIKKQGTNTGMDCVFLDPIIDPLKKYILEIEVENTAKRGNYFFFGLVKDQEKDNVYPHSQQMCYCDYDNSFGITKILKGCPMQQKNQATSKHNFEVRIYLNQKFLRVASLPDYSSVAELDDPNKINPKVAYRFFLSMNYQGDMMRINNMRTVEFYDDKM